MNHALMAYLFEDTPEEYEMRIACVHAAVESKLPIDYNGHEHIVDAIPIQASRSGVFNLLNPTQVGDTLLAIDRHLRRQREIRDGFVKPNPEDNVISKVALSPCSTLVIEAPREQGQHDLFWGNVLHDLNTFADYPKGVHAPELFSQVVSNIESYMGVEPEEPEENIE